MFKINDDMSIHVTRGDAVRFKVTVEDNGQPYIFKQGEVLRINVFEKKACHSVVMQKDFHIEEEGPEVGILLAGEDTRIGEVISKPSDYWYELELNPDTEPFTVVGYDEDGAKVFRLYPEGDEGGN